MRFQAIAVDYDGTLAKDGQVGDSTVSALERAADSGRRLLLVTGRELDDLARVFPRLELFDLVVAENGGLLYRPDSRERVPLGPAPSDRFVASLRDQGVTPLGVGEVMVATRQPYDVTVLEAIRELGMQIGDGVDDETWAHHLRQGDFSRWIGESIEDDELAAAVAAVEREQDLPISQARGRIRDLILEQYTQAAEPETYGSAPT